jgi:hypothetical protein
MNEFNSFFTFRIENIVLCYEATELNKHSCTRSSGYAGIYSVFYSQIRRAIYVCIILLIHRYVCMYMCVCVCLCAYTHTLQFRF